MLINRDYFIKYERREDGYVFFYVREEGFQFFVRSISVHISSKVGPLYVVEINYLYLTHIPNPSPCGSILCIVQQDVRGIF